MRAQAAPEAPPLSSDGASGLQISRPPQVIRESEEVHPLELEAGFAYESLDNGYQDWQNYSLEASQRLGQRKAAYGVLEQTRRFGRTDTQFTGGLYTPLGERWTGLFEAGFSPTHRILPEWSGLGQVQYTLQDGWNVQAGYRHTEYTNARTDRGILTLERYQGPYRWAYTLTLAETEGAGDSIGHRLHLAYYYGERNSITVGFSAGNEVENVGPPVGVITTFVSGAALWGRHWVKPDWAISYGLGWHRQGDLYTRMRMNLGLRRQF